MLNRRINFFPFVVLAVLIGCPIAFADAPPDASTLEPIPATLKDGFAAIDEADLRTWLAFLASDELEGRETGERGYDVASRFCATVFERAGLQPAGDDRSFFQSFEILRREVDAEASGLEVKDASGVERFSLGGNLAKSTSDDIDWSGRWAFVGFGEEPEKDAAVKFGGIPIKDRVVLVLPRPGKKERESRGTFNNGATRIVVISEDRVKSRIGLDSQDLPTFITPYPRRGTPRDQPQVVYITNRLADRLLRSRGLTVASLLEKKEAPPFLELDGLEARITIKHRELKLRGRNVVGILPGSDPGLREEAVAIGAHLDHVGHHGGEIFRGADDDGSGSTGILALTKAFAASPRRPARSVLFLLFAAEEKGLWGSKYYVDHPTIPLKKLIAELQMDMIGRNEDVPSKKERPEDNTNTVYLVGSERQSHDLLQIVLHSNRYVGLRFKYDREDVYGSSDQYNFGERGVPIAFFFTGFHPDYHRPTDTPDKINYPKMARILRMVYASAWDLAERREPLRPSKRF
jgi:peptidase M28-like protein